MSLFNSKMDRMMIRKPNSGMTKMKLSFLLLLSLPFGAVTQHLGQQQLQGNEGPLANEMAEFIIKVSQARHPSGTIKRFNQAKSLGCFDGQFIVNDDLPDSFKVGIFAQPNTYSATARFANASTLDDSEKDLRGLSVRVSGFDGQAIWGEQGKQDFITNSYPVLFAASPEEFYDFIQAQFEDSILSYFLNPFDSHLNALFILLQARDRPNSPFDIQFWSTTAFRFGAEEQAIKYSFKPCSSYQSPEPETYGSDYLSAAMQTHLTNANVCFDFMVQLQKDPENMPIEDPYVEWKEEESAFIPLAKLIIEDQDFRSEQSMAKCEAMTFNPWQSIAEHQPLGRLNIVRLLIYQKLAEFRQQRSSEY